MRIDPKESIAGVPMLHVRGLFRRFREFHFSVVRVAEFLHREEDFARTLLAEFEARGWIERIPHEKPDDVDVWVAARTGRALAIASAGKPLSRKTCDRLVRGLVERCRIVRDSPDFIVRVERAIAFGSYARGAERPADLDVYVQLEKKFRRTKPRRYVRETPISDDEDDEESRIWNAHCNTAPPHIAATINGWAGWPWDQVARFLKNRSTGISLTTLDTWVADDPDALTIYVHADEAPNQLRLFAPEELS